MTTTVPPLATVRPSLYDRWTARIAADPALHRRWSWIAPLVVTLLAAVLRFWNLGHPHSLVFDETYYVKDSWSQWLLGYPATWPDGADSSFAAGDTDIFNQDGSFVVHPPLGRTLIGAGMALFGAANSFGWRFTVALLGTATVLVVYLLARALTRSIAFATVAGLLMAVDGLAIVMSRVSLLDGVLAFFVVLAFLFLTYDREVQQRRYAALAASEDDPPRTVGPVFWNRPWLIAAGLTAGAATAVKWSGLYVIAAIGVYVVVVDLLARRKAGIGDWTLGAVRQALVSFVQLVPTAFVVYLLSWTSWLATTGGWGRNVADSVPATGFWSWVPRPLQSLWLYQKQVYEFHVGLTTGHPYASPAWQWPLLIRPTSMYHNQPAFGADGCTIPDGCVQNIYSMPNPVIWYAGVAAVIYLLWRFFLTFDGRYALVLVGVAATYVPWLLYPERTIFQFYTIAILPFLILALTFALQDAAGARSRDPHRRKAGQIFVIGFLVIALIISAFWYPILTATSVPHWFYQLHNWTISWI